MHAKYLRNKSIRDALIMLAKFLENKFAKAEQNASIIFGKIDFQEAVLHI